jgi:hypothetical protein
MKKEFAKSITDPSAEIKAGLIDAIADGAERLKGKKITAGFDGFLDTIVKVIKEKDEHTGATMFKTIKEFGDYILEKHGASFSLELDVESVKLGGNMPIMANALGRFGITVNCIGTLGYPQIHPVFKNFPPTCHLYSFAEPGLSTAHEFNDGKMMMAQMGMVNTSGWDKISEIIGIETLIRLYAESQLICILNWSEIDVSTDIWKGLLQNVFPAFNAKTKQLMFVDLSDCSKRTTEAISEVFFLLDGFSKYANVILSLNKNETGILYRTMFYKDPGENLAGAGKELFEKLSLHTILIHSSKEVIAINKEQMVTMKTFFTPTPKISTGAGDNFNAGFCAGQLLELDTQLSILLANAFSGFYVRNGVSAEAKDIIEFLQNN